ncbi:translation initiation factor IF-3 [bacterium]|nr:translation initiation factor IF-3 [bacterium]
MLLIDADGEKQGTVAIARALEMAAEAGLDLVEVAGNARPPVCKIMDYGKMAYQAKKKKSQSKTQQGLKELSFSMKISEHDIETKLKKARQFIEKGNKLKFNLILRGRERAYAATNGRAQLEHLTALMADVAVVEQMSNKMVGNRMSALLAPLKVKGKG